MSPAPFARASKASASPWLPAALLLVLMLAYLAQVLIRGGGDPLVFARLGTKYTHGDVRGSEGYDGQFNYHIAVDPAPHSAVLHLDRPAYRYQRILTPLLARAAALGNPAAIPWTLVGLNLAYQMTAVLVLGEMLRRRGVSPWVALVFGLWVGVVAGVRLDLSEPLALLLVLLALWSEERLRGSRRARAAPWAAGALLALSLLAKETMLPFALGWAVLPALDRSWKLAAGRLFVLAPFVLLQAWLWLTFGAPGLISGGAGSSSFEVLPLAGFLRISQNGVAAFAVMAALLLPGVISPALLAVWSSLRALAAPAARSMAMLLLVNAVMVLVAPFSTFREPLGITRLASGMIVCILLFAADTHRPRIFAWGLLWLSYLALLVE
ncbi:MAG: hypothetical protein A2Z30_06605 [Chloroflexi bacterium RBG_16_64_43]|nr:MAG: hypothetical protein A2Z30_06605 [Chloroflexi bacterium RBG_16_64_43]